MTTTYTAAIEVDRRGGETTEDQADTLMERLAGYHPAISNSRRGFLTATITLPAENLAQASTTALAVVATALDAEPITLEVLTTAEHDARQGWAPMPELVSVADTADTLGVTRQRVLQLINANRLPAEKVGREYVIQRSAVDAYLKRQEGRSS